MDHSHPAEIGSQTQPPGPQDPAAANARDFAVYGSFLENPYYIRINVYRPPFGPILPAEMAREFEPDGFFIEAIRIPRDISIVSNVDSSRDIYRAVLTTDRHLNLYHFTFRPPYGPLLPEPVDPRERPGGFLVEERCQSTDWNTYRGGYGVEPRTGNMNGGYSIGDSEDGSEDSNIDDYYDGDDTYYGSESDLADEDTDTLEGRACGLYCDREVDLCFHGCPHAICTRCFKRLWWSRWRRRGTPPKCIPCPFCRFRVSKVGMLSRQPPAYGFGNRDGELTVWEWRPVRRWMVMVSKRAADAVRLYYHHCVQTARADWLPAGWTWNDSGSFGY